MFDLSDKTKWEKVSVKDLQDPINGARCVCDHYWIVTKDDEVLFYKMGDSFSMQCNSDTRISNSGLKYYPECRIEFFKVLYIPEKYFIGAIYENCF